MKSLTWVSVDLKAVYHNLKAIQRLAKKNIFYLPSRGGSKKRPLSGHDLLAVVKSNAYGHGVKTLAPFLDRCGINFFGVSDVAEGIELRKLGINKSVLLFESTLPSFVKEIVDFQLMPTVCHLKFAQQLNEYAKKKNLPIDIHLKVDTGMGRLGVHHSEAFKFIKEIYRLKFLKVLGIYTHFPVADTDRKFTQSQIDHLYKLVLSLDQKGMVIPYIHAANSMGLAGYQTHVLNLSRPGLMIYGLYPDASLKANLKLRPALSVHSKVIFLKRIKKGDGVSYGRTFVAKKDMTIAIIPIGYNNGYLRCFSNKASVLIAGQKCPVIGNVTMDQTVIDVSKVKSPRIEMPVTILGTNRKATISADDLAQWAQTINYEIVCQLGNRLPQIVEEFNPKSFI